MLRGKRVSKLRFSVDETIKTRVSLKIKVQYTSACRGLRRRRLWIDPCSLASDESHDPVDT